MEFTESENTWIKDIKILSKERDRLIISTNHPSNESLKDGSELRVVSNAISCKRRLLSNSIYARLQDKQCYIQGRPVKIQEYREFRGELLFQKVRVKDIGTLVRVDTGTMIRLFPLEYIEVK